MKKLAGLVVILAALFLGSYYATGIITERTLKKNIVMLNQSNGMVVEVKEYHRGWFCSKAELNWSLHIPARTVKNQNGEMSTVLAQDYQMQVPVQIYHGPVMFVDSKPMFGFGYARSQVTLSQDWNKQFAQNYTAESIAPVMNFNIFVSYFNQSTLSMEMPMFKLISRQGNKQFEWKGMTSDTVISYDNDAISGSMTLDGLRFGNDKVSAVLGKVVTDYNLHRTDHSLYLGDANLSMPSFQVVQDNKTIMDVEQLDVNSSSDISEGLFSSHLKVSLGKLVSAGKQYGPALVALSINNLDADVLEKLNRQANEMQQDSVAERQKVMFMMMPELPKLLGKGAKFELSELSVTMPDGMIKGSLQVSLPAVGTDNPFQLIQKIQGQGKFVLSAAVVKQLLHDSVTKSSSMQITASEPVAAPAADGTTAPTSEGEATAPAGDQQQSIDQQVNERLANMVQSGLLSTQGSDYVVEFKLADGKLAVNDKPFDSAMLKF